MQRILLVLLAVTATVSTWFAFQSQGRLAVKDAQIATLMAERDTALAAQKTALTAADLSRENIDRLTRERDRLQAQLKTSTPREFGPGGQLPPPGAGGPGGGRPELGGIENMLKTPEGKRMLQNQAASTVRRQYTDLAKRMKLSPQDTTTLMSLLADRQTALSTARITSGGRADTGAIESDFNEKLKATLGQEGLDQVSEYDQTVPERMAVNQFAEQFDSAGTPLEASQKEGLIGLMKSEREKSPPNPLDPAKNDPASMLNLLKDDTNFSTWEKQQQDYQNRILQSAATTLTPDQVNTLKQVLEQKTERDKSALQIFKTTGKPPPQPPR